MPHVLVVTPSAGISAAPPLMLAPGELTAMREGAGFTVEHFAHPDQLPRRLRTAPPSAIVLPLRAGSEPAAEAAIREASELCPEVPVVVYCPATPSGSAVLAAARAGAKYFAFAQEDDLTRVLRRVLGRRKRVSGAHLQAEARIGALPVLARRIIEASLSASAPPRSVPDLARALGMHSRTLRRALERRGWPPPRLMLDTGRALRALLDLSDGEPPERAASEAGFASPTAVSGVLRRLVRFAPEREGDPVESPIRAQLPRLLDALERAVAEGS